MSKILTSIAIAITLAAAVFGYLNHQRYEAVVAEKNKMTNQQQQLSAMLTTEVTTTKQELALELVESAKIKNNLLMAQQLQQTTMNNLAVVQKQLADKTAEGMRQKNDLLAKDATIQNLQQQLQQQQESATASSKTSGAKKELQETLSKLKAAQAEIQEFKQRELDHKKKLSNGALEGKVLALNPTWKFIVINLGDQNGVINGSEMVIKRDTQIIARVKVTSVEPLTCIADIIPESILAGFAIQAGDVVIYTGPENSK